MRRGPPSAVAAPALMPSPRVLTPIAPVSAGRPLESIRPNARALTACSGFWCATKPTGGVRRRNEIQRCPIEFAGDGRTRGVGRKLRLHERARSDRLHLLRRTGTGLRMPWLVLRRHGAPNLSGAIGSRGRSLRGRSRTVCDKSQFTEPTPDAVLGARVGHHRPGSSRDLAGSGKSHSRSWHFLRIGISGNLAVARRQTVPTRGRVDLRR